MNKKFSLLLSQYLHKQPKESSIVIGKVLSFISNNIYIDIGTKSEGKVSVYEFPDYLNIYIGCYINVYLEKLENKHGCIQISRFKVAKEIAWNKFETCILQRKHITGKIIGRVNKGGYAVLIDGIFAFLPSSQLDVKPINDITNLMNINQFFKILKIDRTQGNLVVSRRIIIEESRKEAKNKLLSVVKEGMIFYGIVKNITNYGAFIDLGDIDGLLHITDISWHKISHPTEKIFLGQKIKVIVIKYNIEEQRVSLGLKQLTDNPWKGLDKKYSVGSKHTGKVLSISDYGVFVELQPFVEGLVYLNEIDWNIKNIHPTKLLNINDNISVLILDIDIHKHRISLSIKQCTDNPWKSFVKKYPIGTSIDVIIKKVLDFGLLVNILNDSIYSNLDLLIPSTEIDYNINLSQSSQNYSIGDKISCIIISTNIDKEKITLSIKQLKEKKYKILIHQLIKSETALCKILQIVKNEGLYVEVNGFIKGFIKNSDISRYQELRNTSRFNLGDKVNAKVLSFDRNKKLLYLSIKMLELQDEKKIIKKYYTTRNNNHSLYLSDILNDYINDSHYNNNLKKK